VPLEGIMPLAHSMDHPGPMARGVMDMALLLTPMAYDVDPLRNFAEEASVAESRPRFGRLRQLFEEQADQAVRDMMDEIAHRIQEDGGEVEEIKLPAEFCDVVQQHRIVMAVEAAQYHEVRLRRHPNDYGPCITKLLEEGLNCPAPVYARAKEHQDRLSVTMKYFFRDMVLLTPATIGPAPLADTTGNPAFNSPWSYTGMPSLSLPSGYFVDGLPLAIQLVGCPNGEGDLFSVAAWCEKRLAPNPLIPQQPTQAPS
jgi:aspartyl-tRNA(Asn)/glutamyl-tRNA(Gln) amidotransferase subunit A